VLGGIYRQKPKEKRKQVSGENTGMFKTAWEQTNLGLEEKHLL